jgi:hypothetical protein
MLQREVQTSLESMFPKAWKERSAWTRLKEIPSTAPQKSRTQKQKPNARALVVKDPELVRASDRLLFVQKRTEACADKLLYLLAVERNTEVDNLSKLMAGNLSSVFASVDVPDFENGDEQVSVHSPFLRVHSPFLNGYSPFLSV